MGETGRYKLLSRNRAFEAYREPEPWSARRSRRIVDSLRSEILGSDTTSKVRLRQIFEAPNALYRLELDRPDLGYQRTTLLDAETLHALLEDEAVRARVRIRRKIDPPEIPEPSF